MFIKIENQVIHLNNIIAFELQTINKKTGEYVRGEDELTIPVKRLQYQISFIIACGDSIVIDFKDFASANRTFTNILKISKATSV